MKHNKTRNYQLLTLAAAITAAGGTLAADNVGIEEVVVTAQKRAESLQDIPLAVSAFSGDQIREDGIASMEDIGSRTPGMVFAAFSSGQPEIAIRGIGTKEDGAAASDSTVVSIDDVYIAARTAQVFDIFDLERVEVLRGPQGTLYGKNSIGGSINFVTSKPTEETEIRVRATTGNYGRRDLGAMISGGLSNNLFGKIAFSSRENDGYFSNVLNGEHRGETDTLAVRGQLRWMASDALEVTFTADTADDDNKDTNREPVGGTGVSGNGDNYDPIAVNKAYGGAGDPHNAANDEEGFTDREVQGYSVKVNWDLENMTFTSITSYRESEFDWAEDSEGLPGGPGGDPIADPLVGFRFDVTDSAVEDTEQLTQEFRLTSAGESSMDWVVGMFYSLEDIKRTETFCIPNCNGNVINPGTNTPLPNGLILNSSDQKNESTSWALYGQAGFDLTDSLSLTAGLRYSYEEKDVEIGARVDEGLVPVAVFVQPYDPVKATDDWSNVSGRLALDWTVSEDVLLYASVSTGFKSGGFIGSASTPERADDSFDEEKAINYELGMKSQWWDNRVQVNVAAFFTDYEDLQVTRFYRPVDNPANVFGEFITENAAEATIQGVEVELLYVPTENLEIGGNFAYLDTEFDDFTPEVADLAPGDGAGPCPVDSRSAGNIGPGGELGCIPDYSGNKLRQAPRKTASLFSKYTWQLGENLGELSAKLNYRFQDHSFYDPDNNDITVIPRYRIWDARLAWASGDGHWEVAGWVKNFTDEEYRTHIYSQRGGSIAFATFGAPKTSGLTVTYSY